MLSRPPIKPTNWTHCPSWDNVAIALPRSIAVDHTTGASIHHQPVINGSGTILHVSSSVLDGHRRAKQMTDEQLALQAVSDAQRILEEYLVVREQGSKRLSRSLFFGFEAV